MFKKASYSHHSTFIFSTTSVSITCSLLPLRIGHHPGAVLVVVAADDNQGDSSSIGILSSNGNVIGELSVVPSSRSEVTSVARDIASLRINEIDDNQSLTVHPQGHSSERAIQGPPATSTSHHQTGTEDHILQQEQLRQLQQQVQRMHGQMEEILGKVQQSSQHVQNTQQQLKDDIDMTLQQTQHSIQQLGERFEKTHQREADLQISRQQLQRQIEEVQQKMQQLNQETQTSRQETQVQVQQQLDEAMDKIQQTGQQAQHSQQQYEQLQQQICDMEKVCQDQGHLSQKAFHQYLYAQHRVRSVLAIPPQDMAPPLFPRLFIILPEPTDVVGRQRRLTSLHFRLYFLCECGTHPIPRSYNNPHQVHLTNHPGYKLHNQKEFIDKFGSYLLTMMYMVKYGARVGGLVVPPLLGLDHAVDDKGDKGHLQFIKKNIGRLVNDAITYLQEAIGSIGDDSSTPQRLKANDFKELKSHPNFKEWQHIHGDLSSITIQGVLYSAVCSDHFRDCYESVLLQSKLDMLVNGGMWNGIEIRIIAASEAMIKLSKDTLGKVLKIRSVKRWPQLTEIILKQNGVQPCVSSTTDIFGVHNDLGYLSLDIGRLWMTSKDISQGEIKNPSMRITDLRDLTSDDLNFIQQHSPIALRILKTPEKEDEKRLISILRQNPSIAGLIIGCHLERYTALINLVISTIEGMNRNGGRPALSSFNLVDPTPLDSVREEMLQFDRRPESMLLKVPNSSGGFNMMFKNASTVGIRTDLTSNQFKFDDLAVCDFIRQFGYSIVTLVVSESFSDRLAKLLDECTEKLVSNIAQLDMVPTSLTTAGLDAMDRIIKRSKGLTYLRLTLRSLRQEQQLEKALLLLEQYKNRVTSVHVSLWCEESCLTKMKRVLPDRSRFPRLEEFSVDCINWDHGPRDIARQWIISMISARTQLQTPLKVVGVKIDLQPQDWEAVIKAIDLSTLEELHFDNCNFSQEQLKLLADHIAGSKMFLLPLKRVGLKGSRAEKMDDIVTMRELAKRIEQKAPLVKYDAQFTVQ